MPLGTRSFAFAHSVFSVGMIVSTQLGLVTIALGKLSIGLGSAGGLSSSASSGYPGSITGAMTGTPALNVVTDVARFGLPAVGYAGTPPLPTPYSRSLAP